MTLLVLLTRDYSMGCRLLLASLQFLEIALCQSHYCLIRAHKKDAEEPGQFQGTAGTIGILYCCQREGA